MFVLLLVAFALVLGLSWWGLIRVVSDYTSAEPVPIQVETTEENFVSADQKYTALEEAKRRQESVTVEFTAAELNALIARHPEFRDMRGKFRVAMTDSIMTLDMSVPLREINLPKIREQWLNGSARFGLIYHEDNFSFSLRSLTANGRELPLGVLKTFASTLNESAKDHFHKNTSGKNQDDLENVKTVAIIGGKLAITTKGTPSP